MWEYTDKVKEHFLHPRNVGIIEKADGVGEVGSLACGDALSLYFKLDDDGRIAEVKFQTFGCASAIASSSALTEIVKGMTLDEAKKVSNDDIAAYLGGLPKEKMHCSVMGREALEAAIANFEGSKIQKAEGKVICHCFSVTDKQIKRVVEENQLTSIEDVTSYIKAGGGCGKCHDQIQEIIDTVSGAEPQAPKKKAPLTNIQKIKLIEETLEREIRPELEKDGGNIELIDVDGNTVLVQLRGTCANCRLSEVTLSQYVQTKLRELVASELVVEEVHP